MSEAPVRHPIACRRLAPAPQRWGAARPWLERMARAAALLNRWLYRLPPGRWLRRRLQRGLEFSRVEIALARGGAGLDALRIAFVSDVHAGTFMDEADLDWLFERVAEHEPHLVCLGGDLVNMSRDEMLYFRAPLRRLDPPLGIFAVPGNHEYVAERDLKTFRDVLSEAGGRVLLNEGERLFWQGESLWLAGVDDHCRGWPDLGLALRGARPDEPVILLSHNPDFFHEAASVGVDLTLSGHTHGGQIVLGGRTPLRHTVLGFWRGHFRDQGAQLYVSRGAGVTILPLRIGAPAEVPILTLRIR